MINNIPTGTITFLFTDIEGSTQLWEREPEAMRVALARHDELMQHTIEVYGGYVFKRVGDAFCAAFSNAPDALKAALAAQSALHQEQWDACIGELRVRMALHTGTAEERDSDYFGPPLNRVARLLSAGHGGQTLITLATQELIHDNLPQGAIIVDLGEHQLKDLHRSERIFQINAPNLLTEFASLKTLDIKLSNLPANPSPFIGREREVAAVSDLLNRRDVRLVTLTGPGGTGKTRLSLQVAAGLIPHFADGVWLVELASLADPALILQTIATALGQREQPGIPPLEMMIGFLRPRHLLLMLDNCEHLVEASAEVAEQFLTQCPSLKLITSSREALGISGETIYHVPSLSLPDREVTTRDALQQCESAQLFVERAAKANPRFALTDLNAAAVAQICHRLDGIPLALELAATRVSVFTVEQIANRLDDRFKLLTGGSRTALPRQQTLRALIDWSYDILDEPERALLRRLSVFTGGWTFEAAEAVGNDLDVLDSLAQLVNKSLVLVDEANGASRYRMLETIRQYARDKLLDAGESEATRNAHMNTYAAYAAAHAPELDDLLTLDLLTRLETEHDNFRSALEWGLSEDVEKATELAIHLAGFWGIRGHAVEGSRRVETALTRINDIPVMNGDDESRRNTLLARAWFADQNLLFNLGDNPGSVRSSERCIDFARKVGDHHLAGLSVATCASSLFAIGQVEKAALQLTETEALARQQGDRQVLGSVLIGLSMFNKLVTGDLDVARDQEEEGRSLLKIEIPSSWVYATTQGNAALVATLQGDKTVARALLEDALKNYEQFDFTLGIVMMRSELAHLDRQEGHYLEAEQAYRSLIKDWRDLGQIAAVAHQLECFSSIAITRGQGARAAQLLGSAEMFRQQIGIERLVSEQANYEREVTALKSSMDGGAFNRAWADGRAMTVEQAIAFAIE